MQRLDVMFDFEEREIPVLTTKPEVIKKKEPEEILSDFGGVLIVIGAFFVLAAIAVWIVLRLL